MNRFPLFLVGAVTVFLAGCGGKGAFSSSSSNPITGPAANVVTAVVNGGPNNNSVNTLYTTVTICAPGSTTNCQTIDNIEIDTGSSGLRILASALTADLPIQMDSRGNALAECTQFVDGYSWGPLALADLTVSQETAQNLPIQVIGDPNFATVPSACASTGGSEDTVETFGANGILGVGTTAQDCGAACTSSDNDFYYSCASATNCVTTGVALGNQVQNPVTLFATDNNGVIIELPSVAAAGAASATGALVFGIDTQSNNASGSGKVLAVETTYGYLGVSLNGAFYNASFLDTGSNGIYFQDPSLTQCTSDGLTDFYCPSSAQTFTATVCAYSGGSSCSGAAQESVNFTIGNAESLFSNDSFTAFPTLGGSFPMSQTQDTVDLGLPFFYGRTVYEAFEGKSTTAGTGPYVSF